MKVTRILACTLYIYLFIMMTMTMPKTIARATRNSHPIQPSTPAILFRSCIYLPPHPLMHSPFVYHTHTRAISLLLLKEIAHLLHTSGIHLLQIPHAARQASFLTLLLLLLPPLDLSALLIPICAPLPTTVVPTRGPRRLRLLPQPRHPRQVLVQRCEGLSVRWSRC